MSKSKICCKKLFLYFSRGRVGSDNNDGGNSENRANSAKCQQKLPTGPELDIEMNTLLYPTGIATDYVWELLFLPYLTHIVIDQTHLFLLCHTLIVMDWFYTH